MLNKKDLQIVHCDPEEIKKLLTKVHSNVLPLIEDWLKTPELRHGTSTIENYSGLERDGILKRMLNIDWPNGLYACQLSQLKLRYFQRSNRRYWRAIRLENENENIQLNLDIESIKSRMESYLSHFFHCYIYAERHKDTDTYLFCLSIAPKEEDPTYYKNMRIGFMIYFPETELIITHPVVWIKQLDKYFKDALLDTFSASKLLSETMEVQSLKSIKELILYKRPGEIFDLLGENELDTNPLDIRQKRQKGFDEIYVKPGEFKKRIVPIDMDEMKERHEIMKESFGWNRMTGHRLLYVDLNLPLDADEPIQDNHYENTNIEISITMEGLSIAEGVKESIGNGLIKLPAPIWLESIGISGAKKLSITTDGVFNEEDLTDPPLYKKNPMF